jgi:hypothetical protein
MLTAILREAYNRQIKVHVQSAAIMKRGVCSFVQKATAIAEDRASLGLLVNAGTCRMCGM